MRYIDRTYLDAVTQSFVTTAIHHIQQFIVNKVGYIAALRAS